jgi:hypothetical protein
VPFRSLRREVQLLSRIFVLLLGVLAVDVHGQPALRRHVDLPPEVRTTRLTTPLVVDGRLDEPGWADAIPTAPFTQVEPLEGAPATERTEIRVLFDDAALYVGVRLFDDRPGAIARQRSRRDAIVDADRFTLYLDPNHDHLTGVAFTVTAAGVQRDTALSNDVVEDDSWDAVWASAVHVDEHGWMVEMRVPFSQLRFPSTERPVWGVNASRLVLRKHEVSWLAPVHRKFFDLV